jgi:hypothetical protein
MQGLQNVAQKLTTYTVSLFAEKDFTTSSIFHLAICRLFIGFCEFAMITNTKNVQINNIFLTILKNKEKCQSSALKKVKTSPKLAFG